MALPVLFGGAGVIFALIGYVYAVIPVLRQAFDIMELQPAKGTEPLEAPPGGLAEKPAAPAQS